MRNLALVCGGLAIVSSIISVNLWRELRAERLVVGELRAQMQAQHGPAMPQTGLSPAAVATPATITETAAAPPRPLASTPSPEAAPARNVATNVLVEARDLLKDPEYRRAALAQRRLNMPQNYPDLAEELNLTPEQTDQLYDLLAAAQINQQAELVLPGSQPGQPIDLSVVENYTRRSQEWQARRDEQIAALLGNAGLDQFKAYEQTVPARMQARNIQRMMETAGMPLTAAQVKPITAAYIADQQRQRDMITTMFTQTTAGANPEAAAARLQELQSERQVERNRSLIEAARPHLTAQQLERLQVTLDQQLAMSRASSRLMRERIAAQAGATGTMQGITVIQGAPALPAP